MKIRKLDIPYVELILGLIFISSLTVTTGGTFSDFLAFSGILLYIYAILKKPYLIIAVTSLLYGSYIMVDAETVMHEIFAAIFGLISLLSFGIGSIIHRMDSTNIK